MQGDPKGFIQLEIAHSNIKLHYVRHSYEYYLAFLSLNPSKMTVLAI